MATKYRQLHVTHFRRRSGLWQARHRNSVASEAFGRDATARRLRHPAFSRIPPATANADSICFFHALKAQTENNFESMLLRSEQRFAQPLLARFLIPVAVVKRGRRAKTVVSELTMHA